jgi:hypothetical protein
LIQKISGDGYLNMGIGQRTAYDEAKKQAEINEQRRLAMLANPIRPKTDREIRNRLVLKEPIFNSI